MTTSVVPLSRPQINRAAVEALLVAGGIGGPAIVGRRGYYRDTLGAPGRNDVGIFDDAIVVITPTAFQSFNANTDPSRLTRDIAILTAGVWRYKLGTHGLSKPKEQRYRALVQAAPVTVRRFDPDEGGDTYESGWFGVNIHRGGQFETLSAGCQTIWKPQWDEFLALVEAEMARHGLPEIPYLLSEHAPIAEG